MRFTDQVEHGKYNNQRDLIGGYDNESFLDILSNCFYFFESKNGCEGGGWEGWQFGEREEIRY